MVELSKCLWASMVTVQCESPYSDDNECLCPDRISFSLFRFHYYWIFHKLRGKFKEIKLNLKFGCIEVILQDELPVCASSNGASSAIELIDFRISGLQNGMEKYMGLSHDEQDFFVKKLPILPTLRLLFQSCTILYEDVESFIDPAFSFFRLAVIAWRILEKISKSINCEQDILVLIKMKEKKSVVRKEWNRIERQSKHYRKRLLMKFQDMNVMISPIIMSSIEEREDPIDLPNQYIQDILSLLIEFLKRYCDGSEVKHETLSEFETQYASVDCKIELMGVKEKDIIVLREGISERLKRIWFLHDFQIGNFPQC